MPDDKVEKLWGVGEGVVFGPLSAKTNGVYNSLKDGIDGYNKVTVDVPVEENDPFVGLNDYIEATGTQWINTNIIINSNCRIECVANPVKQSTNDGITALFGVENTSIAASVVFTEFHGIPCIGTAFYYDTEMHTESYHPNRRENLRPLIDNNILIGQKIYLDITPYKFEVKNTGGQRLIISTLPSNTDASTNYPLWIFDCNGNGYHNSKISYCLAKLYNFKIWSGDALVMNLIPAKDSNNIVCMRDTVTGNYFYNAGTGDFVYGTDE